MTVATLERSVRFYHRTGESTFTTDPERVASGFLAHRFGQRARSRHARRYLARLLAEYMTRMGASWARVGDDDPYGTRRAFDEVYEIVRCRLQDHDVSTSS